MSNSSQPTSSWRKYIKMPHTFVLLVILTLLAAALTYMVPSGEFERAKDPTSGKTLVVPNSYHAVEGDPVSLLEVPKAIVKGLIDSSDIVFFIFIIGGAFQVITATGTIEAVTSRVAKTFSKRGILIIPVFLGLFSVGGFTMGMSSEVMVFVPLGIAIARSLGYDALTGTAMVSLGASVGFTAGLLNPFNVGLAQVIAEVPMFSGMWLRAILLITLLAITSWYIIRYARKVKKTPQASIVRNLEESTTEQARSAFPPGAGGEAHLNRDHDHRQLCLVDLGCIEKGLVDGGAFGSVPHDGDCFRLLREVWPKPHCQ
jgi:uncharacterized ion transporter superfamily protein YfcC